eukprot:TRINITY_DN63984_c0_g1_i1.p1 TRINITY_DN63984_c0_g1~~TRINITY_DN63984_c0_g1_i1.p1  ORF type:complete len:116 (-),score=32.66 TRINITY_DN63984_c0_g1_i1:15-362(-)
MRLVRYQLNDTEMKALSEYFGTLDNSGTPKVNYQAFLDIIQPNTVGIPTKGTGLPSINNNNTISSSSPTGSPLKSRNGYAYGCLLYTSDAADEEDSVDLGSRRIIQKKTLPHMCS